MQCQCIDTNYSNSICSSMCLSVLVTHYECKALSVISRELPTIGTSDRKICICRMYISIKVENWFPNVYYLLTISVKGFYNRKLNFRVKYPCCQ